MLVLGCEILVGNYRFRQVSEVRVRRDLDNLTSTATIKLPALRKKLELKDRFKKGDAVKITLWYEGRPRLTVFEGFVKSVKPNIPLELVCEDATYLLRQTTITKLWKNITLAQLLADVVAGTEVGLATDIPDVRLEKFRASNATPAFILQKIKEDYGLTVFLEGRELFAGLSYQRENGEAVYDVGRNVVSTSLEWMREDEQSYEVKAIGVMPDNKRLETTVGTKGGASRTLHFYNVRDVATLKALAEQELKSLVYEGYKGSLTAFLYPDMRPGGTCVLKDEDFLEREGGYKVRAVEITFGNGGARRTVTLGEKI